MADSTAAKVKIPPRPQAQQKKKKKNAPDKPQPAWLFPPDEANPVLNPRPKTDKMVARETQEREKALDYLKRRVHAAPDRPAPPPQLLTLVGSFLTEYGFDSTSRLFTNERKARQELNGWEDAIGKKIEKGTPTLEKIYRDWYREFKIKQKDETSSSESESEASSDSESGVELSMKESVTGSSDDDSEASSDGLGGSDVDMKGAPKAKRGKLARKSSGSSSSSSTSDSDADDEEDEAQPKAVASKKTLSVAKQATTKPTVGVMINSLKRKAASSSSDSSASSSSSSSSEDEKLPPAKKVKTAAKISTAKPIVPAAPKPSTTKAAKSASSGSSSNSSSDTSSASSDSKSESSASAKKSKDIPPHEIELPSSSGSEPSDSSSDSDAPAVPATTTSKTSRKSCTQPAIKQALSSDSSVTINGDSKKPSASISSASESSSATSSGSSESDSEVDKKAKNIAATKQKKKHEGAKPTQLAALSYDGPTDEYIDNTYKSYEYADRAYKDLSVTRGKGFTKEKNKKKRGSYRGGAIDTSGGKGFKFED